MGIQRALAGRGGEAGQVRFRAATRDEAGNVSSWSAPRCTSVPLDDRALRASSGWSKATGSAYYAGTLLKTKTKGAKLTAPKVTARDVAIVATRCDGCGSVAVYLGDTLLKKVSLQAATTKHRQLITIADWASARTGVLTIRTTTTRPVQIDAIATAK